VIGLTLKRVIQHVLEWRTKSTEEQAELQTCKELCRAAQVLLQNSMKMST